MTDLIFDTETTGFPLRQLPSSNPRQPHLVQLAAILADGDHIISSFCETIYCPIDIPEGATAVHGITTKVSQSEGVPIAKALYMFGSLFRQANRLVAFNIMFDLKILKIAYARGGYHVSWLNSISRICTMKSATDHCGFQKKKWPKLQEAYKALVNSDGFTGAHSADADAKACLEILRALEKKGAKLVS